MEKPEQFHQEIRSPLHKPCYKNDRFAGKVNRNDLIFAIFLAKKGIIKSYSFATN
jgi:hypothetical protein